MSEGHKNNCEKCAELLSHWNALRGAVHDLYYGAVWHADRRVDEAALWEAVRDEAQLGRGASPAEIPFDGVRLEYGTEKLRLIAGKVPGREGMSTPETRAFLLLHGDALRQEIDGAVKGFVREKLK